MPRHYVPKGMFRVRCLGPDAKEHTFNSPDPKRIRVCGRCREKLQHLRESVGRLALNLPANGRIG